MLRPRRRGARRAGRCGVGRAAGRRSACAVARGRVEARRAPALIARPPRIDDRTVGPPSRAPADDVRGGLVDAEHDVEQHEVERASVVAPSCGHDRRPHRRAAHELHRVLQRRAGARVLPGWPSARERRPLEFVAFATSTWITREPARSRGAPVPYVHSAAHTPSSTPATPPPTTQTQRWWVDRPAARGLRRAAVALHRRSAVSRRLRPSAI